MKIAAADHGGFRMKQILAGLRGGHMIDSVPRARSDDDYPDYIVPLGSASWRPGEVDARDRHLRAAALGLPWPPTRSGGSGPVCATTIIPSARGSKTTS